MNRIERVRAHLSGTAPPVAMDASVFVSPREASLPQEIIDCVLTPEAVDFVSQLAAHFTDDIDSLHAARKARRLRCEQDPSFMPTFLESSRAIRDDTSWTIDPLPTALHDRRVDIGDVAPCDKRFLLGALNSGAQGVQVDFDDGNCPTWKNTLLGHFHIMHAVRGTLREENQTLKSQPALLLVRPRAWNMDEMNMIVRGRVVPGAVFDFALHLFHNGRLLLDQGRGPFVYLPKLEGYTEARLWRRIFEFTESALHLPSGCIKSIVLIENIFAAFEMDEILYELRHHSAGLNCGMWDYTASIVVNFRLHDKCILPDRQRFVSMKSPFLQHYMELLIRTCKKRNAPATTGMVPFVLDQLPPQLTKATAIEKAREGKHFEASVGSDGALVYDLELVQPVQEVFSAAKEKRVAPFKEKVDQSFYERILLTLPSGDVTLDSVRLNLTVTLSYALAWFNGHGTVVVNGCVEDSATAEISRAQLWQWIYHGVPLRGDASPVGVVVTASLVHELLLTTARELLAKPSPPPMRHLVAAINLVFRVITTRSPPAFMTTFLLEQEPLTKSFEE